MALLAIHLIRDYPEQYHYFAQKEFTWNKIRQLNRNPLLSMEFGGDGLMIGDTPESGFGLVGSALQNDQRLIVVINGLKTAAERNEEARKLFNWGFRSFDPRVLFQPGDTVGSASVYGGESSSVPLTCEAPAKIFLPHGSTDRLLGQDCLHRAAASPPSRRGPRSARLKVWRGTHAGARSPGQDHGRRCRGAAWPSARSTPRWNSRRVGSARRWRGTDAHSIGAGPFHHARRRRGGRASRCSRARCRGGCEALGLTVVQTREPGGSPHAEALREFILSGAAARFGPAGEALLFSAARIDHIDATIEPALARGDWVVCDRFADSTRAYQGAAGKLEPALIQRLEDVVVGDERPDLTLILDLPAEQGLERAARRRGAQRRRRPLRKRGRRLPQRPARRVPRDRARGTRALRDHRREPGRGRGRRADLGGRDAAPRPVPALGSHGVMSKADPRRPRKATSIRTPRIRAWSPRSWAIATPKPKCSEPIARGGSPMPG